MTRETKRRINRVVTRTGDDGTTGLADGSRLAKTAPRIEALGAVDELNAHLGLLRAALAADDELDPVLEWLQQRLFDLGGALSLPGTDRFHADLPAELEALVDRFNAELPPLTDFILPAGGEATARAHVARTQFRRAERVVAALVAAEPERDDPALLASLNRASDLLFVLARILGRRDDGGEVLWKPRPQD